MPASHAQPQNADEKDNEGQFALDGCISNENSISRPSMTAMTVFASAAAAELTFNLRVRSFQIDFEANFVFFQ